MKTLASILIFFFLGFYAHTQDSTAIVIYKGDTMNYTDENGLKQGIWGEFRPNGQLKKQTFYVDGVMQGGETGYYKNGLPRYTIIWDKGVPHGFYQIYYSSGMIKQTGIWRDDKNVGDLVEYYESGTIKQRSTFNSMGEPEGALIYYYQNEIIKAIEMYEYGVLSGFSLEYDSLGNVLQIEKYQNGELLDDPRKTDELKGILDFVKDQNNLIFVRDSLREEKRKLEIAEVESQAEIDRHKVELAQEQTQKYYLYGGLALLFVFGGFMYNRFRVTQKQKSIIEEQKEEVQHQKILIEESHKEITDSIAYAKRIQSAILPPDSLIKSCLPKSFVLYKPKDVVAGDFYWLEQSGDQIHFAAADCTGHGVPGAMVSVICNNALNRSVREFGLNEPGRILDNARDLVIKEFEKSEEDVKDGMDIALCSLNGKSLKFAGAHNPVWIIRNGELIEHKADKQPIGKFDNPTPYNTQEIQLEDGDVFYIFTDGFADQFGGDKGKKFKGANFKKLLIDVSTEPIENQKQLIDEAFENWRGELEQLDDVCVIGVKI